jgi:hypothetical protein
MNIVELIKNNLSGDMLGQLGSMIGASPEQTKMAAGAAVPLILAGLSKTAGSKDGADRLSSILENLDPELIRNLGQPGGNVLAGKNPAELEKQGGSMLDKVLPPGMSGGLGGLLEKFSGMGGGLIRKLISYLAPLILGTIAKQLGGRLSGQGLSQFFAEQQQNITNAMPAGMSLANLPGLGEVSKMNAGATVREGAGQLSWLLPILLFLFIAAIIYYFFFLDKPTDQGKAPSQPVPDRRQNMNDPANALSREFGNFFSSVTSTLNSVNDVATAETAIPRLTELTSKVDGLKTSYSALPDEGKTKVKSLITEGIRMIKELIAKVSALPGVKDKLKPVVDQLTAKLDALVS